MRREAARLPERLLVGAVVVLIARVLVLIVANYADYVPPDFRSDFLRRRESQFLGFYPWAFYAHILSGPVALVLGLILVSRPIRERFPAQHRRLGRVEVGCVLFLVTPSGLAMAYHAAAGPVAAVGLATLALATATTAIQGARAAWAGRFLDHRRWMWRCFLLLSSAIVLRLMGGLATVTGLTGPWVDPLATWLCWLLPLAAFEWRERSRRRGPASEAQISS